MSDDKTLERARYDARAESQMSQSALMTETPLESHTMVPYLRTPYLYYGRELTEHLGPGHRVMELGAVSGMHTRGLLQTGAEDMARDISPNSLSLLRQRFRNTQGNLETAVADMDNLPLEANSFDVVASAGSLSYGEPRQVDVRYQTCVAAGRHSNLC